MGCWRDTEVLIGCRFDTGLPIDQDSEAGVLVGMCGLGVTATTGEMLEAKNSFMSRPARYSDTRSMVSFDQSTRFTLGVLAVE